MNHRRYRIFVLIGFILLASGCSSTIETGMSQEMPVRAVAVADVAEGVFDEGLTFSGVIKGHVEVAVVPKSSGRIERIAVQVGQRVKPGDLLIQLDAKDIQPQLAQAEAALKVAEAGKESATAQSTQQVLSAEQNVKQAEEGVRQAEKGLEAAQGAYELAQKNLERQRALLESGLASAIDVEQAENSVKQAETGLQQAQSAHANALQALKVAQENLNFAKERIALKTAEAQVEQAKAALDAARRQLDAMRITAPVGGVVASLPANVGEMVSPQSTVATIVDLHPAIVEVELPEQVYHQVTVGDPVDVVVQEEKMQGTVSAKNLTADQRTKGYLVKIEVPNPEGRLASGMSAQVTILPKDAKPTIFIPAEAYMASEKVGEGRVMVYADGVVHERWITIGRQSAASVEVISGLKPGEKVVVKGQYLLKDGDRVRLADEKRPR
ncbi:MAG: efflux RND transporter periplasmic adaptor subunit [Hydrogenibacillus sp.]|nr:efflux RND transporter periplasmic adaptor subunit [Hydrogenibacillus sp.]